MMGKNKRAILLMLLCAGVFFYLFSCEVPYYSDDWWYAWVQEQEGYPTQRIVTLCDVAVSQYNHYMSVNSRVFVNGLVQVVVSFCSKPFFNIVNSCVFIFSVILFVILSLPRVSRREPLAWLFVIAYLFFAMPCHYESFMWATGSISYLWTGCAVLLFCLLWRHLQHHDIAVGWYMPLFVAGMLCGWSHEGYSLGLAAGCTVDLWIRRKHNRRAQYVLYAGFLAGVLFLLLAPCMFLRLSGQVGGYGLFLTGLYLPGLLLPVLLASVWVWLYVRHRRWALRCMRRCRVAIVAAAVSLLIAMVADNGEHRAYWCPSFFCAIPLTYLWSLLWQRAAKRKRVAAVVLSSLLLLFACLVYREHCRVEAQHRELIDTFRKSADGTVVMEIYTPPLYAYGYTLDLRREYLKGWTAWHMKSYYGRPMLNFIPSSLYKALSHPDTFFAEPHRVPGNACLYTLPDIDVYVWPATEHPADTLLYGYAPVSARDNVPLMSLMRRILLPESYPDSEVLPSYRTACTMPDGRSYQCVPKSIYRRVLRIDRYGEE